MTVMQSPEMQARRNTAGRVTVVVLLVIALVATSYLRDWAIADHEAIHNNGRHPRAASGSESALSSMPSFATALVLGGLRGPLVMILWTSSE
ncbi:MAG TPA: hypothetical protein VGG44_06970, partial [Tepidisphaeraceae bacterium]